MPAPEAVLFWTEEKWNFDDREELKAMGRKAVTWLKKALDRAYLSDVVKQAACDLLAVRFFTMNLSWMGLSTDLQDH